MVAAEALIADADNILTDDRRQDLIRADDIEIRQEESVKENAGLAGLNNSAAAERGILIAEPNGEIMSYQNLSSGSPELIL